MKNQPVEGRRMPGFIQASLRIVASRATWNTHFAHTWTSWRSRISRRGKTFLVKVTDWTGHRHRRTLIYCSIQLKTLHQKTNTRESSPDDAVAQINELWYFIDDKSELYAVFIRCSCRKCGQVIIIIIKCDCVVVEPNKKDQGYDNLIYYKKVCEFRSTKCPIKVVVHVQRGICIFGYILLDGLIKYEINHLVILIPYPCLYSKVRILCGQIDI